MEESGYNHYYTIPYYRKCLKLTIATAITFLFERGYISGWIPLFEVKPVKKSSKFYKKYLDHKKGRWCWFSDISPVYPTFMGKTYKWDGMRYGPVLARQIYGKNIISRKKRNPKTNRMARQFKFIKALD